VLATAIVQKAVRAMATHSAESGENNGYSRRKATYGVTGKKEGHSNADQFQACHGVA